MPTKAEARFPQASANLRSFLSLSIGFETNLLFVHWIVASRPPNILDISSHHGQKIFWKRKLQGSREPNRENYCPGCLSWE